MKEGGAVSAANHQQTFLISMECDETGERRETYVDGIAPSHALQKFLNRNATVVALLSERSWRFVVADTRVDARGTFDSLSVRMDEGR